MALTSLEAWAHCLELRDHYTAIIGQLPALVAIKQPQHRATFLLPKITRSGSLSYPLQSHHAIAFQKPTTPPLRLFANDDSIDACVG